MNKGVILKFSLKVTLGISYSLTKKVKHLSFFKGEIIMVNIEFSLYLNPPILKGGVYSVK